MGELRVMGQGGDTKIVWDPRNPDEVKSARATFEELRGKGFNAYAVKRDGDKGEVVTRFDETAAKIILAPPMAGG